MTKKYLISKDSRFFIAQITFLLALLSALSPFATDTYIPALPSMAEFFGVPINLIEISLTVYFIGVAVGQFFGGPLSDSFGRKTVALSGVFLFGSSSLLAVFIHDVQVLWVLRFFQAMGGGAASVVNMAFVRDWFEGKDVARISSLIGMIMMLAPLAAPIIGSFLLVTLGWQSIFTFMASVAALVFMLFLLVMPESRHPQHLTRKLSARQFIGSYKTVFSSPKAVFLVLANSFAVAGMFTFLTGSSFMYIEFFQVDVKLFPIYFGANVVMNVLLTFLNYRLVKTISPAKILHVGLLLQLAAGVVLFFAVRADAPSLWLVFIMMVLFIGSLGLIFANTVALILNQFPQISGSANAVIGVIRFAFSGVVGSLLAAFHSSDLVPMGTIMAICTAVAYLLFTGSRFVRH